MNEDWPDSPLRGCVIGLLLTLVFLAAVLFIMSWMSCADPMQSVDEALVCFGFRGVYGTYLTATERLDFDGELFTRRAPTLTYQGTIDYCEILELRATSVHGTGSPPLLLLPRWTGYFSVGYDTLTLSDGSTWTVEEDL